jgi:acyl-CoA synthetase (AMP-forming)/AMP-acid ligase II
MGARPYDPVSYLEANASQRPAAPAVFDGGRSIPFSELAESLRRVCRLLAARGVGPGSVVAVRLPNIWEYVVLELAVPHLGGVFLPLPLALGPAEVAEALGRTMAGLVLATDGDADIPSEVMVVDARHLCLDPAAGIPDPVPAAPDPNRVVEIALTSGTTGLPKMASLTAGLKQATFEAFTARLLVSEDDRILPMTPLAQGIGGMCLYCLRRGAALVMLGQARFDAEHTLRTASETSSTLLVGVPTNLIRLLAGPDLANQGLSGLRATAVAGSPLSPEVARDWEERTGAPVCSFYGSMDAGQLAVGSPADPQHKRWTTVGRPHDCVEVAILEGEICARGPTIQERYWGERAGPYSADGWAHMGDIGHIDADGFLHVDGRIKDVIIRGGSNVNPYEVENVLRRHPAVQDVCVVGRPDPDLGERAVAFVVSRDPVSLDDIRDHLEAAGVGRYKWPEWLEVIEELPLSGPGKVDRRRLRERASALGP